MKLNVGKRILMFFHWLFSLLICAAFVVYLLKPDFAVDVYGKMENWVGSTNIKIIGGAILAVYLVLVIVQIWLILRRVRRSERGFITVDSSETGRVRIAVSAIEQMVRQSVNSIDGISEMKISIDNKDDAIVIGVAASILNGCHVPTITMNMQRAIRQFVEMNCGVAVRAVAITIHSVTNANETPRRRRRGGEAPAPVVPAPVAQPSVQPAAEPEAPSVAEPETRFESSSEAPSVAEDDPVPEIDFNYKPHLELTPAVAPEEDAGVPELRFDVPASEPEADKAEAFTEKEPAQIPLDGEDDL